LKQEDEKIKRHHEVCSLEKLYLRTGQGHIFSTEQTAQ
jgi:hypothetical protein